MITRWRWVLGRITRRLWVRATLFSVLGALTALLGALFKDYVPAQLPTAIGADAVDRILNIIASSMLAVTTFSLSIMVSAYSAASSSVTPRATTLVMEDTTTQNALATFIGSFLFSLVGIIALSTGIYGNQGRVLLFGVTLLVIVLIIYTLLRWIDHLSRLGRVGETIDRVEAAAITAIKARMQWPHLGGCPYPLHVPETLHGVPCGVIGYVQHIDVQALAEIAGQYDVSLYVQVVPGSFVVLDEPLVNVDGQLDDQRWQALVTQVAGAFSIGLRRTFEHDPRFGLVVLSEIGSRALSAAINDPGTAIDVIGRGVRTLACLQQQDAQPPCCERVYLRALQVEDVFADFFAPLARDAAGFVEINVRLLKALASLRDMYPGFAVPAALQAQRVLAFNDQTTALEQDKAQLRALARELELIGD